MSSSVETASCPHCGRTQPVEAVDAVNGARAPELRAAILAGTFQRRRCDACGGDYQLEQPFLYIDTARRHWLGVFPREDVAEWPRWEREVMRAWQLACGAEAPAVARALGADTTLRTVFGVAALREKLLCEQHGLADALLELTKLRLGLAPSLRLAGVADAEATLVFVDDAQALRLARAAYDETEAHGAAWQPLLEELRAGPFVDLARLRD